MKASPEERDVIELEFIEESIQRVLKWTATGRTALNDEILGEAIDSRMRKLAESTQRLSTSLKESESDIAWSQLSAFRNVMTHDYHEINRDRVWEVIEQDLPDLREAIGRMLLKAKSKTLLTKNQK